MFGLGLGAGCRGLLSYVGRGPRKKVNMVFEGMCASHGLNVPLVILKINLLEKNYESLRKNLLRQTQRKVWVMNERICDWIFPAKVCGRSKIPRMGCGEYIFVPPDIGSYCAHFRSPPPPMRAEYYGPSSTRANLGRVMTQWYMYPRPHTIAHITQDENLLSTSLPSPADSHTVPETTTK